jgi:flap endonuclease-1
MGILGLSKLIADVAPAAIKENEMKNYFGRKVAIDASMSLYQVRFYFTLVNSVL